MENDLPPLPEINDANVRHIEGFLGYAVTDDGRVFGCRTPQGQYSCWKQLALQINPSGRVQVKLRRNGERVFRSVHRLVLETFVRESQQGEQCCHNNGVPHDNRVCNLRWDSAKGNAADRHLHGTDLLGEKHHQAVLTNEQVHEIRETHRPKVIGFGIPTLAKRYGVSNKTIERIIKRQIWSHI